MPQTNQVAFISVLLHAMKQSNHKTSIDKIARWLTVAQLTEPAVDDFARAKQTATVGHDCHARKDSVAAALRRRSLLRSVRCQDHAFPTYEFKNLYVALALLLLATSAKPRNVLLHHSQQTCLAPLNIGCKFKNGCLNSKYRLQNYLDSVGIAFWMMPGDSLTFNYGNMLIEQLGIQS